MNAIHGFTKQQTNEYLCFLNGLSIPSSPSKFKFASVFCGGGGLDLGFSLAGFDPVFSSDVVPGYCETIRHNLPNHVVEPHDISELSGYEVLKKVSTNIDVVIGGPPCQSFSILGARKSTNDPRGQLVYEYARFINEINPQVFLFENVPGIATLNNGNDWEELKDYFRVQTGFSLKVKKLNAVNFGVPQFRQRIILLGFRDKTSFDEFSWPKPSHSALEDDGLPHFRKAKIALKEVDGLPNHVLRKHGERVSTRYSTVVPGGRDRKDHTDRIHLDRPSGTVLVGSGGGGGRPFIHPVEHRHITVREAARLQSFPDWWVFSGGATSAYRQVGNAVPPLMAKAIANEILLALK